MGPKSLLKMKAISFPMSSALNGFQKSTRGQKLQKYEPRNFLENNSMNYCSLVIGNFPE